MSPEKFWLFCFVFPLTSSECWQHSMRSQTSLGPPSGISYPTSQATALQRENQQGLSVANSRPHICMASSKEEDQDPKPSKSLISAIDDFGDALKPEAQKAAQKSVDATEKSKKVLFFILSYAYYMLFIVYRAYRGVFFLSPAIYRRVYAKLEEAVISDIPETNDGESDDLSTLGWRTHLTTTAIASVVVVSYLLDGVVRSISKLLKTQSFKAMIEEISKPEA